MGLLLCRVQHPTPPDWSTHTRIGVLQIRAGQQGTPKFKALQNDGVHMRLSLSQMIEPRTRGTTKHKVDVCERERAPEDAIALPGQAGAPL